MALGKSNFHADVKDNMVTIKLTHFTDTDHIRWRPERYKGTELSNWNKTSRWPTYKPSGLYLGFGNEYMDWRYQRDNVDKDFIFERLHKDMNTERNWNFKHELTLHCNEDDIYIVNTIDDLPNPKFNAYHKMMQLNKLSDNMELKFRKEIGKEELEPLSADEKHELIEKIKIAAALENFKDYHAWDEIQSKYKAVYITQHFFDNFPDVYDLHMRQVIVFDTDIIVEKETYGELFNYKEYVVEFLPEIEHLFDWNESYLYLYNYFYKELMNNERIERYWDLLDDGVEFSMLHVHQTRLNQMIKLRVEREDFMRQLRERMNR